jgi:hypothetical protein
MRGLISDWSSHADTLALSGVAASVGASPRLQSGGSGLSSGGKCSYKNPGALKGRTLQTLGLSSACKARHILNVYGPTKDVPSYKAELFRSP